ncbi:outer membrane homotrimeric porin [Desulfobaculum bizertense]|uniref:Outer membrane porin, OprD family n=1 Tax=Desulfobaculum bizertense DSM 18034 TaxID=1121442 RepID=A0A1T4VP54_9BACT|nr:outer membrane homotrimeric porin [Desulfobaculum bizertense]SKA66753.1 hypothetical protein SAMN02745702_00663 [Desulfobaculum bizertense DSM 18034]
MKRIITLALVAAFVLSMAGFASAKEVKMKAQMTTGVSFINNTDFADDNAEEDFSAKQRMRVYFDYVASESVNAVLGLEMNHTWGQEGAQLGTDGNKVVVKHAYTNFVVPGTEVAVRVGLQPFAFKGAYGSPIFDDDAAGVVVNAPINEALSLSAAWVRAYDNLSAQAGDVDLFTLAAPVQGEGFNVTPYGAFAAIGEGALNAMAADRDIMAADGLLANGATATDKDARAYWAGVNFEVTVLDPITIKGDVIYGAVAADEDNNDRSGYFADLGVEYKAGFGTVGVVGVYGSGNDDDADNGSEAMPVLNDSGFGLTSFGFTGGQWTGTDSILSGGASYDIAAAGLYITDLSFVEGLSHKVIALYGTGTSEDASYSAVTDDDTFLEVNFDSNYQIYENLAAVVELGYIYMDKDNGSDDDAAKAAFYLKYSF